MLPLPLSSIQKKQTCVTDAIVKYLGALCLRRLARTTYWTMLLFACCWVLRPASSQVSLMATTVTATYCESQVHARLCIVVVQIF